MKTVSIISSIFIIITACSTLKRSSSKYSHATQYEQSKAFSYILQQDSSFNMWYLDTDSPFYYHPQRGLWASEGQLWQQDLDGQHALQIVRTDSSQQTQTSDVEKQVEKVQYGRIWIYIILIGLALALVWRRL